MINAYAVAAMIENLNTRNRSKYAQEDSYVNITTGNPQG